MKPELQNGAIMIRFFTFSFTILAFLGSAMADPITERKENFRNNVKSLKLIKPALATGDMDVISEQANLIAAWAEVMPDYFPEDSAMGDTKARPEIWENWDDFLAKANANHDAAIALANLADAGDADALPMAMKALSDTCGACHKLYKY